MRELLIGCGHNRTKTLFVPGREEFVNVTTLDINPDHSPDVIHDLNELPYPFENDTFDEIHAYEVLEHFGMLGDWRGFFDQFSELWRITKPGGRLFATVPISTNPWGDPGHRRVICQMTLTFLSQEQYALQCRPGGTAMTDYRHWYKADWRLRHFAPIPCEDVDGNALPSTNNSFVLQAIKPALADKEAA